MRFATMFTALVAAQYDEAAEMEPEGFNFNWDEVPPMEDVVDETAGTKVGSCPKVVGTWEKTKKNFELSKILGQWKLIYDDPKKSEDLECMTTKLTSYSSSNSTQI